jgi:hypothetical protein
MNPENKKRGNAFRPTSLLKSIVGRASKAMLPGFAELASHFSTADFQESP